MTTKLQFLKEHPLFKNLAEEDLENLAAIAQEYEYKDSAVVAYQRDVADSLYIVKSGRLYIKTVEKGIVIKTGNYLPGSYFGLEWLFAPSVQPATVQAASGHGRPARVLVIKSRDFLHYLSENHHMIDDLAPEYDATDTAVAGFPEEGYREALKIKAKRDPRSNTMNILPDELVEFLSRRSGWFLFVRILLPLFGLILVTVLPFAFLTSQPPDSFLYRLQFICPGGLSLFFIFLIIFRMLDWRNDYFIVTNRRIVHREFNLRNFRVDIKIARIDQIQSVGVDKPSLIANLFNYGTVRITTASQYGTIYFDNIGHPQRVTDTLLRLSKQVKTWNANVEQTLVRQSIEAYFQFDQPYERIVEEGGETAVADEEAGGCWPTFYHRFEWRSVENGTITYRKHFLVLIGRIVWPLIISGIIALLSYLVARYDVLTGQILFPLMSCTYVGILFWIAWGVENWRNDLYQLDGRFILDIDRLPFGFGESRKQAPLQNIQNVKAYTPGILHTIFNYGFVEVETAGVDSNIVFEHVPFPAVVQSDIFQQIEDLRRSQREADETSRHKSFAVLLDVFKQEEEQGRLPRRTPYALEPEEVEDEE